MALLHLRALKKSDSAWHTYPQLRIEESALCDHHGVHKLTDNPDEADVILFATNQPTTPLGLAMWMESGFRHYASKSFVFDSADLPPPLVSGLFPSVEAGRKNIAPSLGWCYCHPNAAEPYIDVRQIQNQTRYLWSFCGSSETHPIRSRILRLDDSEAFVEDTSSTSLANLSGISGLNDQIRFREKYIRILKDSRFVVCPRGRGASSMRIFEAMKAGRVPVIISDPWTPPPFVDWSRCSLRVREADVMNLPDFLRKWESHALTMGNRARDEWMRVFAPTGFFHYTVEACLLLKRINHEQSWWKPMLRLSCLLDKNYQREIPRWIKTKIKICFR